MGDRNWMYGVGVSGCRGEWMKMLRVCVGECWWCPRMVGVGSDGLASSLPAVAGLWGGLGVVGVAGRIDLLGGLVVVGAVGDCSLMLFW